MKTQDAVNTFPDMSGIHESDIAISYTVTPQLAAFNDVATQRNAMQRIYRKPNSNKTDVSAATLLSSKISAFL